MDGYRGHPVHYSFHLICTAIGYSTVLYGWELGGCRILAGILTGDQSRVIYAVRMLNCFLMALLGDGDGNQLLMVMVQALLVTSE